MATPERTVQMMLVALSQGDFIGFVEHFNEQFTFVDHAIELGLKEKQHLIDFLILNRELFPNSKRADNIVCSSGNKVVTEWTLSGTTREYYFGHGRQVPFCARGVSIVQVDENKVSR